jgi:NADH-quinone oxidoreductase subunit G
MPRIYINGQALEARSDQTVMQVAQAHGIEIPAFCWHPKLSIAGNCRICAVQVEGRSWVEIACNMPVAEDLRILTDSEMVREYRRNMLELQLLNHPVDCGICDKAGECLLQDYHYEHHGQPSQSHDVKVHATKFHRLSERITLDNERCVLCSRCVRFTHEISKTKSLGIVQRGDSSLVRASEDGAFARDNYSDNVVDICPVGALLSKSFLYKSRVWYLQATPSVCPGCERGCSVDFWHRKPEWKLHRLDAHRNVAIERITPRENPEVNGPWMCNVGRDMGRHLERPRADKALVAGAHVLTDVAIESARAFLAAARKPVALVSSWASNEELAALRKALGGRVTALVKSDRAAGPGEPVQDGFLIRAGKNPNRTGAFAAFPDRFDPAAPLPPGTDLLLVWGEGYEPKALPAGVRTVVLDAWTKPWHASADVFIPVSLQTERAGHYTNFQGKANAFQPCFAKHPAVAHAEDVFAALAVTQGVAA